jgi:hypothetical protein
MILLRCQAVWFGRMVPTFQKQKVLTPSSEYHSSTPELGGNRFFRTVGIHPVNSGATHSRRPLSWPPVCVPSLGKPNFICVQNRKYKRIFLRNKPREINTDKPPQSHTTKNINDEGGSYIFHPQNGNTPVDVRNIATAARLTKLNCIK